MNIWTAFSFVFLEIRAIEFEEFQPWVDVEVTEVDASEKICVLDLYVLLLELFTLSFVSLSTVVDNSSSYYEISW